MSIAYHSAVINYPNRRAIVWISDEQFDLSTPMKTNCSEADSDGVSIEQDVINIDEFMAKEDNFLTELLPDTSYRPVGEAGQYGLSQGIDY